MNNKSFRFLFALALFMSLLFGPAVLAADGDIDITFGTSGMVITAVGSNQNSGRAIAMQEDGKIVVAGHSYQGSNYDIAVVRYNSDGTLDTSFDGDGKLTTDIDSRSDISNGVAIQFDGKIVVAGRSANGGNDDFAVVRYNSDGTLDTSFSGDGKLTTAIGSSYDIGRAVAIQEDGKIVVAGYSHNGSRNDIAVVRYNSDGTLDTSFDSDGKLITDIDSSYDRGHAIAIQEDGKIVVAGSSYNGSNDDIAVVRYNSDGTLDASFSSNGKLTTAIGSGTDYGKAVAIQEDGKIVVGGYSNDNNDDIAVVRYNSDGTLDISFDSDGIVTTDMGSDHNYGNTIAIQEDGKIVVAGSSHNGSNYDIAVVRYNSDGTLDTSFSGDGKLTTSIGNSSDVGKAVAIQSDGKIVVAGQSGISTHNDIIVVRYESEGSDTPTPTPTLTATPTSTPIPSDDPVILALSPLTVTTSVSQTFEITIEVQADTQQVDGVSAYLNFEPAYQEVATITLGNDLPVELEKSFDNDSGQINLSAGTLSDFPSGTFMLATITFTATAQTDSIPIDFNLSGVRSSDAVFNGASVLNRTIGNTIVIHNATLSCSIDLEGRPPKPEPLFVSLTSPLELAQRAPRTEGGRESSPTYQFTPTMDSNGTFTVVGIESGSYELRVKYSHTLQNMQNVTLVEGHNTFDCDALREGDADNNNVVNILDFSILAGTFGKCEGTTGYDERADFDENNCVNILDFSLLAENFGQTGAEPWPWATLRLPDAVSKTTGLGF